MDSRWGSAISGALGGAGTGAAFGGWGAIPGALLGALAGYFGSNPDEYGQSNLQTPEQKQALSQILSNMGQLGGPGGNYQLAQGYLSSLLSRDPQAYERFAAPYMQQFETQTVPRLAERFAGYGGGMGGGALGSSGFAQALGGAGAQLQSDLARRFSEMQYGAAGQAGNLYSTLANLGLGQRAFTPTYQPGTTGIGGALGEGLAAGMGKQGGQTIMEMLQNLIKKEKATGTDTQ